MLYYGILDTRKVLGLHPNTLRRYAAQGKTKPNQKTLLKQWFGVTRFVYNQTIKYLREPGTK